MHADAVLCEYWHSEPGLLNHTNNLVPEITRTGKLSVPWLRWAMGEVIDSCRFLDAPRHISLHCESRLFGFDEMHRERWSSRGYSWSTRKCDCTDDHVLSPEIVSRMIRSVRIPIPIAIALPFVLAASCRLWAMNTAYGVPVAGGAPESGDDQSPMLIATADFNRDGVADVAEIVRPPGQSSGPCFLQILFGKKNGGYSSAVYFPLLKDDPQSMVAGDFNGDGNPDLLVGDGDGSVTELPGDGKGSLKSGSEVAHVGSVVSMAVGDFNHDGIPDIAVSDFSANALTILLGSGAGSFTAGWSLPLPMRGTTYYLSVGDFNLDGIPDLAVTSDEEGAYVVMLGNGNGTFTYAPQLSHIRDPYSYCPT